MTFVMRPQHQKVGLKKLFHDLMKRKGEKLNTVIEIGTYAGDGTNIIANFTEHVYTVDPFIIGYDPKARCANEKLLLPAQKKFLELLKRKDNISFLQMTSIEAFENETFDEPIDVVYIDGDHRYEFVKQDIELWKTKCQLAITGHDYQIPSVRKAVLEILGTPDKRYQDSSWVKYINP